MKPVQKNTSKHKNSLFELLHFHLIFYFPGVKFPISTLKINKKCIPLLICTLKVLTLLFKLSKKLFILQDISKFVNFVPKSVWMME